MTRAFDQVDVFTDTLTLGNPVAVVHDAGGLDDEAMATFARWTNLSETTFVVPPSDPGADYGVRIFTTSSELPFAGHPTLGTARAWLERGGVPRDEHGDGTIVQQCGAGLVPIRRDGSRLAFAAPPRIRSGPVDAADLAAVVRILGVSTADVVDAEWADNGPGWVALLLTDAEAVLSLEPDRAALAGWDIGVVGRHARRDGDADVEVRAFTGDGYEDPVTGSLNAAIGQWLIGTGTLPDSYVAAQGTRLGRRGRVFVERSGGGVWVGGDTVVGVSGSVQL